MKRVAILGATGSVGAQALAVCADDPELHVVALAGGRNGDALRAAAAGTASSGSASPRRTAPTRSSASSRSASADVVLNAIVGAAGLDASLAALRTGADLALANKESLVAGGPLVLAAARRVRVAARCRSTPSTRRSCSARPATRAEAIVSLVLTASGGPFRGRTPTSCAT